ncbi:hypothetical protein [uncultured Clostridium sp.]|jgi:hypothetical protein|uniref:hypothetical protein n=1 Tax=uncultured Clostridium sp. TaxID=59620 RepID=UPI002604FF50|nr:hypothetical protein [uncultured Clostridium sp.]
MSRDSKVEDLNEYIDTSDLSSRAITIDAIATDQLESEFLNDEITSDVEEINVDSSKYQEYEKALKDLLGDTEEEYVDAFENIVYLADLDGIEEYDLDGSTQEIFPGVRALKKKDSEEEVDNDTDEW